MKCTDEKDGGDLVSERILTFDSVVHICGPQRLTTKAIGVYENKYKMEMRCAKCGARLQPGDQMDHFWPYFVDNNRCRECLQEDEGVP